MIRAFALIGVAVSAGVLSLCPLCGGASITSNHRVVADYATTTTPAAAIPASSVVTLKITGMTCGGCVFGVRKVLTQLDGVAKADVSYEKGTAVVNFDPSKVSVKRMIAAVKVLGYTAVVAA